MEVGARELYDGQPLKDDMELFMQGHAFVCVKDTVNVTAGDQLYVKRELLSRGDVVTAYIAGRGRSLKRKLRALFNASSKG